MSHKTLPENEPVLYSGEYNESTHLVGRKMRPMSPIIGGHLYGDRAPIFGWCGNGYFSFQSSPVQLELCSVPFLLHHAVIHMKEPCTSTKNVPQHEQKFISHKNCFKLFHQYLIDFLNCYLADNSSSMQ